MIQSDYFQRKLDNEQQLPILSTIRYRFVSLGVTTRVLATGAS
jgi:hypothetical protein